MTTRMQRLALVATMAAAAQTACKTAASGTGAKVKEFQVIGSGGGAGKLSATVDGGGVVTFGYSDDSGPSPVSLVGQEAGPKELVTAVAKGDQKALMWKDIEVGAIDGAGAVELCSGATETVCDAQLEPRGTIDPLTHAPSSTSTLRLALTKAYMAKSGSGSGLGLADAGVLDVSEYAMPEINQSYSATCLYNSTTAIMEWYRNRALGVRERLSAPDTLARLDAAAGFAVGERYAIENTSKLQTVLPDRFLPTQKTYDTYGLDHASGFQATINYAQQQSPRFAANRVPVPGPLHGKVLYMIAEPARRAPGGHGVALADIQKVRDWIATYHTPVHFFAMYGDIWHAIVALGYRDDGWLLIKDSLQVKPESAHWVSLLAYQQATYGAVGTWSDDKTIAAKGAGQDSTATPDPAAKPEGAGAGVPSGDQITGGGQAAGGGQGAGGSKCLCVRSQQNYCGLMKDNQWVSSKIVQIVPGQTQTACIGDFCRQWLAADLAANCPSGVEDAEYK